MPRFPFLSLLLLLLVAAWPAALPARAETATMPVSALQVGMKGVGKTVILGTTIQDFDIEIIGILERGGFNGGPMILVRGSGPVLDATGGFAGGYSGSPVYIDGKMFGAISAAWYFADHSIAGVTPIEEMFKNFGYPQDNTGAVSGDPTPLSSPLALEGTSLTHLELASLTPSPEEVATRAEAGILTLTPCKTPLFVNGLNPALIERVKEELGPRLPYIEIMPGLGPTGAGFASTGGGSTRLDLFSGLQPGAAVGAQLVAGDIDMTAIGTLTYIDQNKVLAFGHPFLQVGAVELPLTKARIVHTMKSIQRSFKMGESMSLVGTIDQDRAAGISGVLGKSPRMIPFHLTIRDTDLGRVRRYNYSVVDYEAILPFLGLLPPMQGLSEVMDRQGPATIRSHFRILTDKLPPIERTNLFYDQFSGVGFMELVQGLYILTTQNIFEDVEVQEVVIEVEVTQNRQTSDIIKAEIVGESDHQKPDLTQPQGSTGPDTTMPEHPGSPEPQPLQQMASIEAYEVPSLESYTMAGEPVKVRPGQQVTVEVHLKPYREAERRERLTLTIPKDLPVGQTTIEVRGGGRLPSIFQLATDGQGMPAFMGNRAQSTPPKPPESLQDLINEFLKGDMMNELVIELYRPGGGGQSLLGEEPSSTPKSKKATPAGVRDVDADSPDQPDEEPIKTVQKTDRVIFGSVMLPVEIVGLESGKPAEKQTDADQPKEAEKPQEEGSSRNIRNRRNRGGR